MRSIKEMFIYRYAKCRHACWVVFWRLAGKICFVVAGCGVHRGDLIWCLLVPIENLVEPLSLSTLSVSPYQTFCRREDIQCLLWSTFQLSALFGYDCKHIESKCDRKGGRELVNRAPGQDECNTTTENERRMAVTNFDWEQINDIKSCRTTWMFPG